MRLIDADALIDFLDVGHLRHPSELCFSEVDVANLLLHAPTISPDEVRGVGEWEDAKQNGKRVLDPCCGSRMFWFDKNNPDVEFCDIRELHTTLCDGRKLDVAPDTIADFRNLPFESDTFWHVVFDPPHMTSIGDNSWMAKKYGELTDGWEQMLKAGFDECMRVLKPNGTLIFKWNEQDVPVSKILNVVGYKPLYGHKSGKLQKTHWMAFIKDCPSCGIETNIFDQEEIHPNCTVQILRNSITGEISIGWWPNEEGDDENN